MLNYLWTPNESIQIESGVLGIKGKRADSQLDWYNAPDPRPDYYQNYLPILKTAWLEKVYGMPGSKMLMYDKLIGLVYIIPIMQIILLLKMQMELMEIQFQETEQLIG